MPKPVVAILIYGLIACGWLATRPGLVAVQREPLTFWNGFTGPDGTTMLEIVRDYNASDQGPPATMQRMQWHTYYNKLFVAGLGDRSPDVFVLHASALPRFVQAGLVRPVDDLFTSNPSDGSVQGGGSAHGEGLDPAGFDAAVIDAVRLDGRTWGVPLDVHPYGLYFNRKLFREAGIVDERGRARPTRNRAEFVEAIEKLNRDTDGDGRIDQWGFAWTNSQNDFLALAAQSGARFFNDDLTEAQLDSPALIEALTFASNLIHKWELVPEPESAVSWIGFRQGRVGMVFQGVYMVGDLKKLDHLDYGAAPLPQLGPRPGAFADSHVLCLGAHLNDRRAAEAWALVRDLSDQSLRWAQAGQVPVRPALRSSERFAAMPVQSAFAEQMDRLRYPPKVPFVFEFLQAMDIAVQKALHGSATPEAALRQADAEVEAILERRREEGES